MSGRCQRPRPHRRFESPQHDIDAGLDIGILIAEFADSGFGAQKRDAAARDDDRR
jgi:hypothetical protein